MTLNEALTELAIIAGLSIYLIDRLFFQGAMI